MNVCVASHNLGKIKEFKEVLEPLGYHVVSLSDVDLTMDGVEEIYDTFHENALLKAQAIAKQIDMIVIADDSGLTIEALPGELGVKSARYMGEDTDYRLKNENILQRLEGNKNRNAFFTSAIAFVDGDTSLIFEGVVHGTIATEILGAGGFGYDPLFVPDGYDVSYGLMNPEEKNAMSHRAIALRKMAEALSVRAAA